MIHLQGELCGSTMHNSVAREHSSLEDLKNRVSKCLLREKGHLIELWIGRWNNGKKCLSVGCKYEYASSNSLYTPILDGWMGIDRTCLTFRVEKCVYLVFKQAEQIDVNAGLASKLIGSVIFSHSWIRPPTLCLRCLDGKDLSLFWWETFLVIVLFAEKIYFFGGDFLMCWDTKLKNPENNELNILKTYTGHNDSSYKLIEINLTNTLDRFSCKIQQKKDRIIFLLESLVQSSFRSCCYRLVLMLLLSQSDPQGTVLKLRAWWSLWNKGSRRVED